MSNLGNNRKSNISYRDECGEFHDALEALQLPPDAGPDAEMDRFRVLAQLPIASREHARNCSTCMEAVDDFAAIKNFLLPLTNDFASPAPGPWFSARVMNAIAAQEREPDGSEAVWAGVRKFAPRFAAFSALLLALAGTWAFQVQQRDHGGSSVRPVESVFEPTPAQPLNDDVMASASIEDRR
jgi:hypothetical protein